MGNARVVCNCLNKLTKILNFVRKVIFLENMTYLYDMNNLKKLDLQI